jgi:hypothetical protein
MPKLPKAPQFPAAEIACNNTVKLPVALRRRVVRAMQAQGFTVWAEFCRVALTEKCHGTEDDLRTRNPGEYKRIYQEPN